MIHERSISLGSDRINLAEGGSGEQTLLFLHGVTRRWQSFLPLWSHLGERYRLLAVDYRGHGASERSERGFQVIDYLRDLCALLDLLATEQVIIYGHSLGAMLAAAVAAERPGQVRGIIMEDPPWQTMGHRIRETPLHSYFVGMAQLAGSPLPLAAVAEQFANLVVTDPQTGQTTRMGDVRDAVSLRFTASCLNRLQPAVLEPILRGEWLDGLDLTAIAKGVRCPALVLQADLAAGGMLIEADARFLMATLADGALIRFPGVGHLIHWARTRDVINHTLAFGETLS
jgi:pimeloyl-ACP methyl ester carboxylesterase